MSAVGGFFKNVGEGIVNVGRNVLEATPLGALIPDQAPAQPESSGQIDGGLSGDDLAALLLVAILSSNDSQSGSIGSWN